MYASLTQSECIGCGKCAEVCPEVFHILDSPLGFSEMMCDYSGHDDAIREAAELCPMKAIQIIEE